MEYGSEIDKENEEHQDDALKNYLKKDANEISYKSLKRSRSFELMLDENSQNEEWAEDIKFVRSKS